jgi:glycosyltransferase involved in cell wall biosynthesis
MQDGSARGPRGRRHRVLYVNSWSSVHGGSSTSLLDIVSGLDRDRFDPLVVCPAAGDLPERLKELSVPVVIHPLSRCNRDELWRFLAEVPWYVRFLKREGVDIVHGNTSASRRSLLQAVRLLRLPYIQHVRNPVRPPLGQYGFRIATRIVTNSDAVGTELRADRRFAGKTLTIHNAVDLSRYESHEDRRRELGAGDRPIVGFVGQLVARKGVTTAIRAMPLILGRIPNALLVIVGCSPPNEGEYESECRMLVKNLDLESAVRFVGYRRDIPAWMRTFTVFALPTRSEPFGKVVIEAMAASRPVVVTNVGGIPEIVSDPGLGTLVPPDEPQALAEGILRYLADSALQKTVGERAARHARSKFALGSMIARIEDVYRAVLLQTPPTGASHGHAGIPVSG